MIENLPIIFVHGFGSGSYTWKPLLQRISIRSPIFVLDLPGGSISEQAEFLETFRRQSGIQRFRGVGHSMGANVLGFYSLHHPHLECVVFENPADDQAPFSLLNRMIGFPLIGELALKLLPFSVFKLYLSRNVFDSNCLTSEFWRDASQHFTQENGRILRTLRAKRLSIPWPEIKVPCTIIYGESDEQITPEFLSSLKQIPHVSLYPIGNCKHVPHLEYPERFVEILKTIYFL